MSSQKPVFSIIIPTYNSEATLNVALDSIFKQSIKDLEVIIIDGLSNDKTIDIAKKYSIQFDNLNIYSEKDKGVYDAMNKGIDLASGNWLLFLGSDDFFYEDTTLEVFLNQSNVDLHMVVYGNVYSTRFGGVYDGEFNYSKLTEQNICHQSIFFKKSVFEKIGKFNLKYTTHADWDHNMRWFFSSKVSHLYINQIIANYADNGLSSQGEDLIFKEDRFLKIISLGLRKIPLSVLLSKSKEAIVLYKAKGRYFKFLVAFFLRYSFKFLVRLKFNKI